MDKPKLSKQERKALKMALAYYKTLGPTGRDGFKHGMKDLYEATLNPPQEDK